ncbi:MAG TPA: hypothetical protein VJ753_07470 [Rhizomicrobium sp.]|nr:hypothetical protein [Rhizomicrobium sp.]
MRKAATLVLVTALAMPGFAQGLFAAEHGAPKAEHGAAKAEHGEAKKGAPGTNVDMPYLMAPLIDADGKLTGYAYISSRLTASAEGGGTAVRAKLPFIQDLMVRDVNTTPVTTHDDPEKVDIAATEKRLLASAAKVMGPGKVKLITICTIHISPLKPVQTPARDTPPEQMIPAGTTPKNPIKSRCEE